MTGLTRRIPRPALVAVGLVSTLVAGWALAGSVEAAALGDAWRAMTSDPFAVGIALGAFALAFVVRAWLWVRVLPALPFRHALAGIHLALGANHVLPLRLGEPLRIVSALRSTPVTAEAATASTVTLRSADILAVGTLGWILGPATFSGLVGAWGWAVFAVVVVLGAAGLGWLVRVRRAEGEGRTRLPGPVVAAGSLVAWLLEAVLVWQCARFAGIELSAHDAVLITAVAVSAQIVAIAPGGIGTYEAASVAAYVALGYDGDAALVAAITTHALKTAYSFVAGAVAVVAPQPSLLGRLRLAPARPARPELAAPPDAPVVLFFPAHDEGGSVADVVARTPAAVHGRPVISVVIDDGSTDDTAPRAAAAGATVVSLGANRGLGAAVRAGLEAACARGAAAVAFADADGEYAPEELARITAPILDGSADYVVGSRFAGEIGSMRPHRRAGNLVLTTCLAFVARAPITDGQSGYRALSLAAAADAEIVHDYNYAQVLTLDLLGKGYRYAEVPISYSFRTSGRSFIRLGRYLRRVVPAVYRELNGAAGSYPRLSVLHDVRTEAVAS